MHRTAFTALAAAAVATGALGVPAADAATLEQLINSNQPQFNLEDDSAEDLGVDANNNGRLDEGDTLRGVFSFQQFVNVASGDAFPLNGTTNSAVHGVFEAQVAQKTPAGAGFDYTFQPYAPFAAEVGGVDGAMIGLWESDAQLNPFNCGDKGDCDAAAKNGALVLALGFDGGADVWTADNAPDNLQAARNVPQTSQVADYAFQISVLSDNLPGLTLPLVPEVIGSGSILGSAGSSSPFPTFNDADIQMAVVPVPAALPLFLAGMGALGMIGWRRNAA